MIQFVFLLMIQIEEIVILNQMYLKVMMILLCINLIKSQPTFNYTVGLRTGQYDLLQPSGILNSTPAVYFPITYSPSLTMVPAYTCVGLIGYQSPIANDFNYNLTTLNLTSGSLIISVIVYGDTRLNMVSINYMAVGNVPEIEILYQCFQCTKLLSGMGPRVQARNTTFLNNLAIPKFTVGFISAIRIKNNYEIYAFINLDTKQISNLPMVETSFITDGNNTVSSICYYVLVCYVTPSDLKYTFKYGSKQLSNTTSGRFLNQPPILNTMFMQKNTMFFGISGFRVRNDYIRKFYVNTTANYSNLDINYASNTGTEQINICFLFLAFRNNSCSPNFYLSDTNQCVTTADCTTLNRFTESTNFTCYACHYSCLNCSGPLSNQCSSCDSNMFRSPNTTSCPCINGSIDYFKVSQCSTCDSIIYRCSICSFYQYKLKCDSCGFYRNVTSSTNDTTCECPLLYFDINGLCTNTTGCANYTYINQIGKCNLCNQSANYKLSVNSSFQCQCADGFLSNNSVCINICGDGKLVNGQYCDDGNNVSLDGCSSSCVVEAGWKCSSLTLQKSLCYKTLVALNVAYIRRVNSENQMNLGIKMDPLNFSSSLSSLKSVITHNIPCSSWSVQFSQGLIVMFCYYNESLEGKNYQVNFTFDPLLPTEVNSMAFSAVGMNSMLTYDSYYSNVKILQILIMIVNFLGLVLVFFSLWSEKLIGIQMIQTIQSVFFLLAFLPSTPNPLSVFQKLKYSNGINIYSGNNYQRIYPEKFNVSALGFESQFLASFNIMLLILIFTLFIIILLKIFHMCTQPTPLNLQPQKDYNLQPQKDENLQPHKHQIIKQITISQAMQILFGRLFIIITFICFFSIIFSVGYQLTDSPNSTQIVFSPQLNIIATYCALFILFFLFTFMVINYIIQGLEAFQFKHIQPNYPILYLCSQFIFILIVTFFNSIKIAIFSVLILSICNIVLICLLKPYPNDYHNRVLIVHQIVLILTVGIYFGSSMMNQMILLVLSYILTIMLYLILFLNGLRLWKWRNYNLLEDNEVLEEKQFTKQHLRGMNSQNKMISIQRELEDMSMKQNEQVKDFQWFHKKEEMERQTKQKKQSEQLMNKYKKTTSQEDEELKILKKRLKREYKQKSVQKQ